VENRKPGRRYGNILNVGKNIWLQLPGLDSYLENPRREHPPLFDLNSYHYHFLTSNRQLIPMNQQSTSIPKLLRTIAIVIIFGISIIPIARMTYITLSVGEDNLSNDYLHFLPDVLDGVNNGFSISDLSKTCFRGQCEPLTYFVMMFNAKYFHWSVYAEILFSSIIHIGTVILVYLLFAGFTLSPRKLWVSIFISAICFSFTVISTFTFGQASIYSTTCLFGLCLALLGIQYYSNSYKGLILLILGMWISVWSYGAGVLVKPILFVGLLFSFRHRKYYLLWFVSLACISLPYWIYYLQSNGASAATSTFISFFRVGWVLKLIGYYFSNNFGIAPSGSGFFYLAPQKIGLYSLIFLFIALVCLVFQNSVHSIKNHFINIIRSYFPHFGLLLFGIGSIWQISLVREGIGSWYVINALPYWLALIGLYFSILIDSNKFLFLKPISLKILSIGFLGLVVLFYVNSNLTYEDKILHLASRAPASAACLRYYQIAPTYCEGLLFQWGVGQVQMIKNLAEPLEINHLSVFAPEQKKFLQGEYLFDSKVKVLDERGVSWWTGLSGELSKWDSYKHLDVLLSSPNEIVWAIDIPQDVDYVWLKTAVGIHKNGLLEAYKDSNPTVKFVISVVPEDGGKHILFSKDVDSSQTNWAPVEVSLMEYKGEKIEIHFSTSGAEENMGKWAMYKFPLVQLKENQSNLKSGQPGLYLPENTDLSSINNTIESHNDLIIDERSNSMVGENTFQFLDDPTFWRLATTDSSLVLKSPISACINNYSDLVFSLSVTPDVVPRALFVVLTVNNEYIIGFQMPLLLDGNVHSYTYPVRLLNISPSSKITNMRINLPKSGTLNSEAQFYGVRLLASENMDVLDSPCGYPEPDVPAETVVGEITRDIKISQSFTSVCKNPIDQIGFYIGTYGRTNTTPIHLSISDQNGDVLRQQQIDPSIISDNKWHYIDIYPIADSLGKQYWLSISSPQGVSGNSIAIYRSATDQYPDGELLVNNEAVNGDLVFRYSCSEKPQ
jgi:hypothetical protein